MREPSDLAARQAALQAALVDVLARDGGVTALVPADHIDGPSVLSGIRPHIAVYVPDALDPVGQMTVHVQNIIIEAPDGDDVLARKIATAIDRAIRSGVMNVGHPDVLMAHAMSDGPNRVGIPGKLNILGLIRSQRPWTVPQ